MDVPRGLWGIADALPSVEAARGWESAAAPCSAWTLRRPACGDRAAVGLLRAWHGAGRWVVVHGRGDLAAAAGAQAVIAGWRGLPFEALRRVHPGLPAGASVHAPDEAQALVAGGAAFLLFGPVWDTPSKHGLIDARGVDALAEVAAVGIPVVAIGGVQRPEQVEACAAAGAHAVAVLRAAADPVRCAELAAAYPSAASGPCTGLA